VWQLSHPAAALLFVFCAVQSLVMLATSLDDFVAQLEPTFKAVWGRVRELEGEVRVLQRAKAAALEEAHYQSRACDKALSRVEGFEEKLEHTMHKLEKTQVSVC